MRIRDIAMSRPRFGYERIHVLLRREGWHVNLESTGCIAWKVFKCACGYAERSV